MLEKKFYIIESILLYIIKSYLSIKDPIWKSPLELKLMLYIL